MFSISLFLFSIITYLSLFSSYPIENNNCIVPSQTLDQLFTYFNIPVDYCIQNINNSTKYEFHISYPHTQPSIFSLTLIPYPKYYNMNQFALPPGSRRPPPVSSSPDKEISTGEGIKNVNQNEQTLIQYDIHEEDLILHDKDTDMEKLIFETDNNNNILVPYHLKNQSTGYLTLPNHQVKLRIYIRPRGYMIESERQKRQGTWYNLRFDPYYYNIIPSHSKPLLYLVPLTILITLIIVHWLMYSSSSPFYQYTLFTINSLDKHNNEEHKDSSSYTEPLLSTPLSSSISKKNKQIVQRNKK